MAFGVYVHIPYCLQRCVYCDFATYEAHQILPPSDYIEKVKREIATVGPAVKNALPKNEANIIDTLYFGGGTPSLLEPELLIDTVNALGENGFKIGPSTEVTMEINPATLDNSKIEKLLRAGFNRFSVGAQSFNEEHLKIAHRKHSAQDTRDTLSLLKNLGVNFSADLLFALPTQTTDDLKRDLDEFLSFDPPHISPYCLTVPESNPMAKNRPPEDDQIQMFNMIETALAAGGLFGYEISNFAKPGYESRHNLLYWEDQPYWGIGLSSHSYLKVEPWGVRFWNPRKIQDYIGKVENSSWSLSSLSQSEGEFLMENQAMTDYFHTSLRCHKGVSAEGFFKKFKRSWESVVQIDDLRKRGLVEDNALGGFRLTPEGILISNYVFERLTFLN